MKKLLLLISFFAALTLMSCEDQQVLEDLEKSQGEKGSTIDYDAWSPWR